MTAKQQQLRCESACCERRPADRFALSEQAEASHLVCRYSINDCHTGYCFGVAQPAILRDHRVSLHLWKLASIIACSANLHTRLCGWPAWTGLPSGVHAMSSADALLLCIWGCCLGMQSDSALGKACCRRLQLHLEL
jgi:hypothetical protein